MTTSCSRHSMPKQDCSDCAILQMRAEQSERFEVAQQHEEARLQLQQEALSESRRAEMTAREAQRG